MVTGLTAMAPLVGAIAAVVRADPHGYAARPSRFRAMLIAELGPAAQTYHREIHLLTVAVEENLPRSLRTSGPLQADLDAEAAELAQVRGWTLQAASEVVTLWARALEEAGERTSDATSDAAADDVVASDAADVVTSVAPRVVDPAGPESASIEPSEVAPMAADRSAAEAPPPAAAVAPGWPTSRGAAQVGEDSFAAAYDGTELPDHAAALGTELPDHALVLGTELPDTDADQDADRRIRLPHPAFLHGTELPDDEATHTRAPGPAMLTPRSPEAEQERFGSPVSPTVDGDGTELPARWDDPHGTAVVDGSSVLTGMHRETPDDRDDAHEALPWPPGLVGRPRPTYLSFRGLNPLWRFAAFVPALVIALPVIMMSRGPIATSTVTALTFLPIVIINRLVKVGGLAVDETGLSWEPIRGGGDPVTVPWSEVTVTDGPHPRLDTPAGPLWLGWHATAVAAAVRARAGGREP